MTKPITYTTNHKYTVVSYSPNWPLWYQEEAAKLRAALQGINCNIQHIGSTSIPGMPAKPQLDLLLQLKNVERIDGYNEQLTQLGYMAYGDILGKGGRLYSRWENGEKAVNLHVYPPGSHTAWSYLAIRDYLLTHPQAAKEYAELKLALYEKYPNNYLKYREFKDPYILKLEKSIADRNNSK